MREKEAFRFFSGYSIRIFLKDCIPFYNERKVDFFPGEALPDTTPNPFFLYYPESFFFVLPLKRFSDIFYRILPWVSGGKKDSGRPFSGYRKTFFQVPDTTPTFRRGTGRKGLSYPEKKGFFFRIPFFFGVIFSVRGSIRIFLKDTG